jgi:hypothetical protein
MGTGLEGTVRINDHKIRISIRLWDTITGKTAEKESLRTWIVFKQIIYCNIIHYYPKLLYQKSQHDSDL